MTLECHRNGRVSVLRTQDRRVQGIKGADCSFGLGPVDPYVVNNALPYTQHGSLQE